MQEIKLKREKKAKLTEQQVKDFEKEIGYPFPEDYRDFMLATNGGHRLIINSSGSRTVMTM